MEISKEQLESEEFKPIAEGLYLKQVDKTSFVAYNGKSLEDIDLDNYDEDELEFEVSGYYKSIKQIRQKYKGESNFIIASCIIQNEK